MRRKCANDWTSLHYKLAAQVPPLLQNVVSAHLTGEVGIVEPTFGSGASLMVPRPASLKTSKPPPPVAHETSNPPPPVCGLAISDLDRSVCDAARGRCCCCCCCFCCDPIAFPTHDDEDPPEPHPACALGGKPQTLPSVTAAPVSISLAADAAIAVRGSRILDMSKVSGMVALITLAPSRPRQKFSTKESSSKRGSLSRA
jgi:hypothetical protein